MAHLTAKEPPKQIAILGGSYSGISTAHYLLKHVISGQQLQGSYQIVLISASSQTMCRPACPRAMISDEMFDQNKLFVNIQDCFQQYSQNDFRFIHGLVTELDHTNKRVYFRQNDTNSKTVDSLDFHALVIATGASTPSPLLGFNPHADGLRSSWAAFRKALQSAKSIIIAGGGPAGVETAGELAEYLNGRPGMFQSRVEHPKVQVTIITAGSEILPVLRPSIAKRAEGYLTEVGVTIIKNKRVKSVSPSNAGMDGADLTTKASVTLEDGGILEADLYIPATGTKPNTNFVQDSLLASDGRIKTNPRTLRVDKAGERVYSIGDVGSYSRPAIHNILSAVPVLCANIERDLTLADGRETRKETSDRDFKEDTRETQLVPIGRKKGVGAAMGYQLPNFMVRLIKGRDYWLWTTGNLWNGKQWSKRS